MLQGGLIVARIQFDVIKMLVKKLLVGHNGSISCPIFRWGNFILAVFPILYEKNLLFMMGKDFVQITLWYTKTAPTPSVRGPHDANPLATASI